MRSATSVCLCLSVCVSLSVCAVRAVAFEILDLETSLSRQTYNVVWAGCYVYCAFFTLSWLYPSIHSS